MLKVKVFDAYNTPEILEEKVNNFIKCGYEIKDIKFGFSTPEFCERYSAMIIYEIRMWNK